VTSSAAALMVRCSVENSQIHFGGMTHSQEKAAPILNYSTDLVLTARYTKKMKLHLLTR
jgi:hypothetical protein